MEWNQVYRYDHFIKNHPTPENELTNFAAEHLTVSKRPRRNAVVHRNGLIEIFTGPYPSPHLPGRIPNLPDQILEDITPRESSSSSSSSQSSIDAEADLIRHEVSPYPEH